MKQDQSRGESSGAVLKGSQRQIQRYVNEKEHVETLNCALATVLGNEFCGEIEWVSPLESRGFAELRDGAFIRALGLNEHSANLSKFWPPRGPRWDALGRGETTNQVFLVEAKSYPKEVNGSGLRATEPARSLIESSLRDTVLWLQINDGVTPASWTGHLYQSANRLAHLYFLRRSGVDAFLLNVCFVNDPHRATDLKDWLAELVEINRELGVDTESLPYVRNIFLPALL